MLVIDLMHEFELGVWKAVLIHLIRILIAQGGSAVQEFNQRSVVLCSFVATADIVTVVQVSTSPFLRTLHNPALLLQCVCNEETGCPRLRRYPTGDDRRSSIYFLRRIADA